jgi:glutamate-5-semialdehyde dehydrogenase
MSAVIDIAKKAKLASGVLARLATEDKNRVLLAIARRLADEAKQIAAANREDLRAAEPLVKAGHMSDSMFQRLKLGDNKVAEMVRGVEQVAKLSDPVGAVGYAIELDEGLRLYRVNCPIGVLGVIFESRPDALVQIATLGFKSGNAVLLKGGKEAQHSNRALFHLLHAVLFDEGMPADAIALLETRQEVDEMLTADGYIDLVIPRGSYDLVRYIQTHTHIPVLGHAEGVCHVYVDSRADLNKAVAIAYDAKVQYPAVCNAMETLLVHRAIAARFLPPMVERFRAGGVELRCDTRCIDEFGITGVKPATEMDWRTEYGDLILSIKVVDSLDEAIAHINAYGSKHTDAIVTEDSAAFERFFAEVDSAGVFCNASTRFSDGFRYGFGAEVGISTYKLHPRGPVGLEGLVTYKYKLVGDGHTVATYAGAGAKPFTHRPIGGK